MVGAPKVRIELLAGALRLHGDASMALVYLNTGNTLLERAGRRCPTGRGVVRTC